MRYLFPLSLLLLLLSLSCRKDDPVPVINTPPPTEYVEVFSPCNLPESGTASAIKISAPWNSTAQCRSILFAGKKYWIIELFTCSENNEFRENIFLGGIPDDNPKQHYALTESSDIRDGYIYARYVRLTSDGDVLDDFYHFDTLAVNDYLIIDKWDTLNSQIEGRFRASFDIRKPRNNPDNPEKVTFWKGKFQLPLRE